MKRATVPGRLALACAYTSVAAQYWLRVFPGVRRHIRHWVGRAEQIPDPALRALALDALESKQANIEGAAAFALLAPRARRGAVVRAEVAFAALCDYLDTLCEQPSEDPVANGRQLHRAQLAALDGDLPDVDYYAHHGRGEDGGYLRELARECRAALGALPSYQQAAPAALRLAEHAGRFQSLNLTERQGTHEQLAQWARSEASWEAELLWWETAAAANSTLGILALLAIAARPTLAPEEAIAIETAYRPWVEALHTLLDGVADEREDAATGQRSLLGYYASSEEAAARLSMIAEEAIGGVSTLPNASTHLVIIAAMVGLYLCPAPETATGALVSEGVLDRMGFLAKPTVLMFRTRRTLSRLKPPSLAGRWRAPRRRMDALDRQSHHADSA